jgi:hypothetical protein
VRCERKKVVPEKDTSEKSGDSKAWKLRIRGTIMESTTNLAAGRRALFDLRATETHAQNDHFFSWSFVPK